MSLVAVHQDSSVSWLLFHPDIGKPFRHRPCIGQFRRNRSAAYYPMKQIRKTVGLYLFQAIYKSYKAELSNRVGRSILSPKHEPQNLQVRKYQEAKLVCLLFAKHTV